MRPNIEYCVGKIDEALQTGNKVALQDARHHLKALENEIYRLKDIAESREKEK